MTACVAVSTSTSRPPRATRDRDHLSASASERSATFPASRSSAEPFTEAVPIFRYAIHCWPDVFTNAAWSSRKNFAIALTPRSGKVLDLSNIRSRATAASHTCRMGLDSIFTSCTPSAPEPYARAHSRSCSWPP